MTIFLFNILEWETDSKINGKNCINKSTIYYKEFIYLLKRYVQENYKWQISQK